MADDDLEKQLNAAYDQQALEAQLDAAYGQLSGGPQHGAVAGMAYQALDAATLNAAKYFQSDETIAKNKRFARENPGKAFVGQAAGFIAPMFTPAGWVSRTPAMLAKAADYALPFGNMARAVAPGAGAKTLLHESGKAALKTGAWMRGNEPIDPKTGPLETGEPATDLGRNVGHRLGEAFDLKKNVMDYGLGAGAGWAGAKVGGAVGGSVQKLVDQIPRFSWAKGSAGNGYYDWTRGGAQRANEAITGDLRPGQSLEEAATHGMLGEFRTLQPSAAHVSGYARQPASHGYKYEIAQRYTAELEKGLSAAQARAKVAQDIIADPALTAKYNLRGKGGTPKQSTIERHVGHVAKGLDDARQLPTTLQERVAMSAGGESAKGTPTYGVAPNSYAALDEMLTSPGSKDPGSARATASNWISQRQQTQNERLKTFLDERLGSGDVSKALDDHLAKKAAAYDLYDPAIAAWKADPRAPDALRQAISKAHQDWRARPENVGMMMDASRLTDAAIDDKFMRPLQIISPQGTPGMKQWVPPNDLQQFIAQRSNFAKAAEALKLSDPATYRAMKQFQKEYLDKAVRPLAPDWARANDLAADTWGLRRAFSAGETFPFGATTRQAEILKTFKAMNDDYKAMFLSGFNARLQKMLGGKTSTGDQHVLFSKHEVGDALRALLGKEQGNAVLKELQAVAVASKTNKIFGQSATHGREAEERANSYVLKIIQSLGNMAASPIHGLGQVAKWGTEKMATEAGRARNDRALRILTANTDDMPNYFKQIKDVTNSSRNYAPAVTQRLDELLRKLGLGAGVYSGSSRP
jgi:hypothetical protein